MQDLQAVRRPTSKIKKRTKLDAKWLETRLGNGKVLLHCSCDTNKLRGILHGALEFVSQLQTNYETYRWTNDICYASIRALQLNNITIGLVINIKREKA